MGVDKKKRLSNNVEDKRIPPVVYNHHILTPIPDLSHGQLNMVLMGPDLRIVVVHHPDINSRGAIIPAVDAECAIHLIQVRCACLNRRTAHHAERLGRGVEHRYRLLRRVRPPAPMQVTADQDGLVVEARKLRRKPDAPRLQLVAAHGEDVAGFSLAVRPPRAQQQPVLAGRRMPV